VWETGYRPQFLEDLIYWMRTNPRLALRLATLMESVGRDPFSGIGQPEPLKHLGPSIWSRRLNAEHRVVYRIDGHRIDFLQARYHYEA